MKLKLSFKARIKQLFCKHDKTVGWTCYTSGTNKRVGSHYLSFECYDCKMTYGKWIDADHNLFEELYNEDVHVLG